MLNEHASVLNVVDVTGVASRLLFVSPSSLHSVGLGSIQQFELSGAHRMYMGNFQFFDLMLPWFFVLT